MSAAIIARMGLDSGEYRKDLAKVAAEHERAQKKMAQDAVRAAHQAEEAQKKAFEHHQDRIKDAAGEVAGVLGVGLSIGGVIEAGKAVLEFAGSLADASDATGVNVVALQELRGAFSQSGADAEVVTKSIAKLGENMVLARDGDEKLIATFRALGVSWQDLHNLAPDEVIMKIAESSADASDPAERLSQIIAVMGKSGVKMAAGLNGGVEALRKLRDETSKLSKDEVDALDAAGDAMTRLETNAKVLGSKGLLALKELIKIPIPKILMEPLPGHHADAGEKTSETMGHEEGHNDQKAQKFVPLDPSIRAEHAERIKAAMELLRLETENANKLDDLKKDQDQARADAESRRIDKLFDEQIQRIKEYSAFVREQEEKLRRQREASFAEEARQRKQKLGEFTDDRRAPGAATARRRSARKDQSLRERFEREQDLDARHGHAKADADDGQTLEDRLRPRMGNPKTARGRSERLDPGFQRASRDADLREGMAGGRTGKAGEDFTGAMNRTQMAADIAQLVKNLVTADF